MTRHKHAQTGLVTPSPLDHWIDAMLLVFAMLVHIVASTLQMICRRDPVIGIQLAPTDLPQAKTDTQQQETQAAAKHRSPPQSAHAEQARFASRPSKHERVLTAPSVSHAMRAIHLPQCSALMEATQRTVATKGNCLHQSEIGGGGSPRLRGETEGACATRTAPTPNKNAPA